jgi:hypothetical protein
MKATWWITMIAVLALPLEPSEDATQVSYQGIHENGQFYAAIAVDEGYDEDETFDDTQEEDASFDNTDAAFEEDQDAGFEDLDTDFDQDNEVSWASAFQEIGCTFVDCSQ